MTKEEVVVIDKAISDALNEFLYEHIFKPNPFTFHLFELMKKTPDLFKTRVLLKFIHKDFTFVIKLITF